MNKAPKTVFTQFGEAEETNILSTNHQMDHSGDEKKILWQVMKRSKYLFGYQLKAILGDCGNRNEST